MNWGLQALVPEEQELAASVGLAVDWHSIWGIRVGSQRPLQKSNVLSVVFNCLALISLMFSRRKSLYQYTTYMSLQPTPSNKVASSSSEASSASRVAALKTLPSSRTEDVLGRRGVMERSVIAFQQVGGGGLGNILLSLRSVQWENAKTVVLNALS